MSALKHWFWEFLVSIDQCLINGLVSLLIPSLMDDYWADETWSSRVFRMSRKGGRAWRAMRWFIDATALVFGQHAHCKESYINERLRMQAAPEER